MRITRRTSTLSLVIADNPVTIQVIQSSRSKRLTLSIHNNAVRLSAPLGLDQSHIRHFAVSHRQWISRMLQEQKTHTVPPIAITDQTIIPLLGKPCTLHFRDQRPRSPLPALSEHGNFELVLGKQRPPTQQLVAALKRYALPYYTARAALFCARLGVACPDVRLTSAATRWGSCSSRSGIRIHWRLIHLPPDLIDYVIAHEVAHLREMNHSSAFWTLVAQLFPDYSVARQTLKRVNTILPIFIG